MRTSAQYLDTAAVPREAVTRQSFMTAMQPQLGQRLVSSTYCHFVSKERLHLGHTTPARCTARRSIHHMGRGTSRKGPKRATVSKTAAIVRSKYISRVSRSGLSEARVSVEEADHRDGSHNGNTPSEDFVSYRRCRKFVAVITVLTCLTGIVLPSQSRQIPSFELDGQIAL